MRKSLAVLAATVALTAGPMTVAAYAAPPAAQDVVDEVTTDVDSTGDRTGLWGLLGLLGLAGLAKRKENVDTTSTGARR